MCMASCQIGTTEIMENQLETTVTCKVCGAVKKQISFKHLQTHNMTVKEYREKYPDAVLQSLDMIKRATKNSGQHMKTEKYKKMFSEMFKGENNPNHKNNSTVEQRKSASPFSIEFYRKNNPNATEKELEQMVSEFAKRAIKDRVSPLELEYYKNQNMSEEDAKKALKDRQTTFSLEKCIKKYGEEIGKIRFTQRQEKWINSLNKNGNLKIGYSKISQTFFKELEDFFPGNYQYAKKNGELRLNKENGGKYMYDFVDIDNKKIIEFHGDFFHANPKYFSEDDNAHPFRKISAKDQWYRDEIKKNIAEKNGYELMIVWESDYRKVSKKRKKELFEKCVCFLKQ